jgi:AraC-like DNA-binding protein
MFLQQQWSGLTQAEVDLWLQNFRTLGLEEKELVYKLLVNIIYFSEKDLESILREGVYNCVGYMGGFGVDLLSDGQAGNVMRRSESLRGWKIVRASFAEGEVRFVATILERLLTECESERNIEIIRAYLSAFLAEIDRRATRATAEGDLLSDRFVAMVFEASDRRASIGEYAERLGVSVATLYRVVKRSTGKTPLAWIDEAVVSEAKALLNHTDLSVNEIGARVGVLDPSYFSRFFRKQVGVSPVDFREMMKKSHQ